MTTLTSSLTTFLSQSDLKCVASSVVRPRAGCCVVLAAAAPTGAERSSFGSSRASRCYHLLSGAGQFQRDYREGISAHFGNRKSLQKTSWQCFADLEKTEPEAAADVENSASPATPNCCTDSTERGDSTDVKDQPMTSGTGGDVFETYGPGKRGNQLVALASVTVAVGLFLSGRLGAGGPGLPELAASAISYQEALRNGRPTVVEFYADWCEVCKETAHDVYQVEQEYKDQINFVMLNVDNSKWEQELDEFGVEGIPHFAFLDGKGNEEGNIVGRLPRKILQENLAALARGDATVPHTRVVGQYSNADSKQAPSVVSPRSHSQM